MSSQLKEKQQQTDNKREFEADQLFNQHLFKTLAYAGAGFGAGMAASLFFKNRKLLTLAGAGAGAAYGGQGFMNDLNHFRSFKDQNNQGQQSNTLKRDDQTFTKNWDQFKPKEETQNDQKRFGGSDNDDHDRNESKSKSGQNKTSEPTIANTKRDSPATTSSSHNKDDDKSSHEFGKSKGQSATSSSHDRTNDKSSQQFGENKSNSSKSSHDSNEKISQQSSMPKSSSHHKEHEKSTPSQHKKETNTSSSNSKTSDRSESSKFESKSDNKGEGQQLQQFKSNPYEAGKPAEGESERYRGSERPRNTDKSLDNLRDQTSRSEQDRWGESKKTGNKMQLEAPSETRAGNQFNATGLTAKSQVNTVLE